MNAPEFKINLLISKHLAWVFSPTCEPAAPTLADQSVFKDLRLIKRTSYAYFPCASQPRSAAELRTISSVSHRAPPSVFQDEKLDAASRSLRLAALSSSIKGHSTLLSSWPGSDVLCEYLYAGAAKPELWSLICQLTQVLFCLSAAQDSSLWMFYSAV